MNIFEMNVNEIDDIMNNILNETTPEMLMKELKECGYKNVEITDIENEVNRTNKIKRQYGHKNFLHKNRTSELSTFEENMEVA